MLYKSRPVPPHHGRGHSLGPQLRLGFLHSLSLRCQRVILWHNDGLQTIVVFLEMDGPCTSGLIDGVDVRLDVFVDYRVAHVERVVCVDVWVVLIVNVDWLHGVRHWDLRGGTWRVLL
jgi:hypothetical protein